MGKLPKHFLEVSSINFRNSGVNRFKLVILQCFLSPLSIYAMIDQLSNEDHLLANSSLVFPLYAQKKMIATRAEERSRWKGLHLLIFSALSQWLFSNASRIVEATCSRPHHSMMWCCSLWKLQRCGRPCLFNVGLIDQSVNSTTNIHVRTFIYMQVASNSIHHSLRMHKLLLILMYGWQSVEELFPVSSHVKCILAILNDIQRILVPHTNLLWYNLICFTTQATASPTPMSFTIVIFGLISPNTYFIQTWNYFIQNLLHFCFLMAGRGNSSITQNRHEPRRR